VNHAYFTVKSFLWNRLFIISMPLSALSRRTLLLNVSVSWCRCLRKFSLTGQTSFLCSAAVSGGGNANVETEEPVLERERRLPPACARAMLAVGGELIGVPGETVAVLCEGEVSELLNAA
jgi:hypothetical protein